MLKWHLQSNTENELSIYISTSWGTVRVDLLTFDEDYPSSVKWIETRAADTPEYLQMQVNVMKATRDIVREMERRSKYLHQTRARHINELTRLEVYTILSEIGEYTSESAETKDVE